MSQYELMHGRDATEAIRSFPLGYLPIGCLERHGDHLPMGLDIIKAHKICCILANAIGGIVYPPHYYAGIHNIPEHYAKITGEWGNIYTDRTAKDNLIDIIDQIALSGIRVLVLYSGHYPVCQTEILKDISDYFASRSSITIIPFWEQMIMQGDHAGISETSFMLYLCPDLVDMTRIGPLNYQDHHWREENSPEKASIMKGEKDVQAIIDYLKVRIAEAMSSRQ